MELHENGRNVLKTLLIVTEPLVGSGNLSEDFGHDESGLEQKPGSGKRSTRNGIAGMYA